VSSLEKSDYELAVKLNTSEREGVNKQNELKPNCFFFLKTHHSQSQMEVGQNSATMAWLIPLTNSMLEKIVV
jgi:hypothetical protein